MSVAAPVVSNAVFGRLPAGERRTLAPDTEAVETAAGDVLARPGERIKHVYFPRSGVVVLFASATEALGVGVGMATRSGIVGFGVAGHQPRSLLTARALGAGSGHRVGTTALLAHLPKCPALRQSLIDYSVRWASQVAQNTACAWMHPTKMRLARWLLDVTEGTSTDNLFATQEAMAAILGIQRAAVNIAATVLQRDGLISYSRGDLRILERGGLARLACRCSLR